MVPATSPFKPPWGDPEPEQTPTTSAAVNTNVPTLGAITSQPVIPSNPTVNPTGNTVNTVNATAPTGKPAWDFSNIKLVAPEPYELNLASLQGNHIVIVPLHECQEFSALDYKKNETTKIVVAVFFLNDTPTFHTKVNGYSPLQWQGKEFHAGDSLIAATTHPAIKDALKKTYLQCISSSREKPIITGKIELGVSSKGNNYLRIVEDPKPPEDVKRNQENPHIVEKFREFLQEYAPYAI